MTLYRYSIFDCDPHSTSANPWPSHDCAPIEAPTADMALRVALRIAEHEGRHCGEYTDGATLHVTVWDDLGAIVATGAAVIEASK